MRMSSVNGEMFNTYLFVGMNTTTDILGNRYPKKIQVSYGGGRIVYRDQGF
jgi:hypothetical protein